MTARTVLAGNAWMPRVMTISPPRPVVRSWSFSARMRSDFSGMAGFPDVRRDKRANPRAGEARPRVAVSAPTALNPRVRGLLIRQNERVLLLTKAQHIGRLCEGRGGILVGEQGERRLHDPGAHGYGIAQGREPHHVKPCVFSQW